MKKIVSKHLPFKGYRAMAIFPFLFIREEYKDDITEQVINHESIHFQQQKEMLIIPFYVWYIIEFIIKFFIYKSAYKNISFEREAYSNADNLEYLKTRKWYSFFKYII